MGLIFQLSLLASHVRDFERLPELDELGNELLQQYVQQTAIPLGEAFQSVLDVEFEIGSYLNALTPAEQESRPYLVAAMQALVELHEQLLPADDCSSNGRIEVSMNLEEVAEWANRLNAIQESAFSMYLFWVTDVLEEETAI